MVTDTTELPVVERAEPTYKQNKIYELIGDVKPGGRALIGYGGAAGGGKTRLLVELAIDLACDFPGNRIVVGRKDFTSLRTTTMEQFDMHCPQSIISGRNKTEHWVKIRLDEWPEGVESTIFFRELKDYLSIGSEEYGAVLIDEAGEVPRNTALMLLSRMRHKLPKAVMDTRKTSKHPEGRPIKYIFAAASNPWPGWFEDWFVKRELDEERLRELGSNVHFIPALPSDNPYLPEDYEDSLRATFPDEWVKRLMEGRWDAFQGQVYPELSEKVYPDGHLYASKLPPEETWKRIIGGLDFGGNNPHSHFSAGIVAIELQSGRIIRVAEFEEKGVHVFDRQLAWMKQMELKWCNRYTGKRIHWVADKSQFRAVYQWKRMGFRIRESQGGPNSVEWGISQVKHRLDKDGSGIPGSCYIPELHKFPERMKAYRYAEPKDDDNIVKRVPIKRDDDLVDADRYMHENLERTIGDPNSFLKNVLPVVRQ